jgi:hypothetical protein
MTVTYVLFTHGAVQAIDSPLIQIKSKVTMRSFPWKVGFFCRTFYFYFYIFWISSSSNIAYLHFTSTIYKESTEYSATGCRLETSPARLGTVPGIATRLGPGKRSHFP